MVTALDEAVGGIIERLESTGMAKDTVIFYTTGNLVSVFSYFDGKLISQTKCKDNGGLVGAGGRNGPFRGQKATLWQGKGFNITLKFAYFQVQQRAQYD